MFDDEANGGKPYPVEFYDNEPMVIGTIHKLE